MKKFQKILASLLTVATILSFCTVGIITSSAVATASSVNTYKNLNSGNISTYNNTITTMGDRDWQWPIAGSSRLSGCYVDGRNHRGLDVAAPNGTNVTAAYPGKVISATNGNGFGNHVIIEHTYKGATYRSLYAHLSSISVTLNSTVTKGQLIGKSGDTGTPGSFHLHFSIWKGTASFPSGSTTNVDPFLNNFLLAPASMIVWDGSKYPNNAYSTTSCCQPYLDAVKWNQENSSTTPPSSVPNVYYRVRTTAGSWLPQVTNTNDYAGIVGRAITDVAISVSSGSVKYRVHVKGGNWLSYVTGYDINNASNGYAGNGQAIDAIQVIYTAPNGTTYKSYYRVSPLNSGYYSYQMNDSTANGMDGYAGSVSSTSKTIDRLQIYIGS